MNYFRIEMYS